MPLKLRQVIPPLTARGSAGRTVRAWDFKQKRSLVVAFLHLGCAGCDAWLAQLLARAGELAERDAVALAVFSETLSAGIGEGWPANILVAADVTGRAQRDFLGEDAFGPAGQTRVGVFVTDRYGELFAEWSGADHAALPLLADVLAWLTQVQIACEECGAPHWQQE